MGRQTKTATVTRPRLWVCGGGGGGGLHACMVSGTPGTRQPELVGATQLATGTHHAVHPKTPCKPHPAPAAPPPSGGGGGGRADRLLPEKEKANNCLSTNKGLPKGEGTHCTNQDQSCNSDWVYHSLATAKQKSKKLLKEGAEGVRMPEGGGTEQAPPPAGTQRKQPLPTW